MTIPQVSVIIPNYNHARFLQRRLDSIFNQTFQDFDIIILDDASTDGSRDVIEKYRQHPKVKAIAYNAQNSGSPFGQWQKGIDLANTDWIWIAESDDYCDPGFLESLAPAFNQPDCVLAYSEINWVDDVGQLLKAGKTSAPRWMEGPAFLKQHMLMEDHLVNAGMVVFRKAAALQVSPEWLQMKQAGDYWCWCEIARQGRVYSCGAIKAFFRRHAQAFSNQPLQSQMVWKENLEVWDRMLEMGSISAADYRKKIKQELVQLETQRKGHLVAHYAATKSFWREAARARDIKISSVEIARDAWWRKLKHKLTNLVQSDRR